MAEYDADQKWQYMSTGDLNHPSDAEKWEHQWKPAPGFLGMWAIKHVVVAPAWLGNNLHPPLTSYVWRRLVVRDWDDEHELEQLAAVARENKVADLLTQIQELLTG